MLGAGIEKLTKYQPVGLPEEPSWSWEVRTMRILGAMIYYEGDC